MKDNIKNTAYAITGVGLLSLNSVVNAIDVKTSKDTTTGDHGGNDFIATLDNMLGYVIGLLYFIAVCFALYGGFQILTASGDEEKVKKGKTTLINAVIGLVVIFLSSIIVNWIIKLAESTIK